MKAMNFLSMVLAAMLASTPSMTIKAVETADTTKTTKTFVVKNNPDTKNNARPITQQEKDVAKEMARQGGKMGRKAAQMAVASISNPSKAKQLESELEEMANEMERLGDSLDAMSEDTTFFYEGDESEADSVALSEDDLDELKDEFEETFGIHWPLSWWGKLLGGSLGIMGGLIGVFFAFIALAFIFLLFTAPLWIVALVIWALVRNSRRNNPTPLQQTPLSTGLNSDGSQQPQPAAAHTATGATAATTSTPVTPVQSYRDENMEMFKSGIMYACVGLGLILLFVSIGLEDLWGIGALVACIGAAKIMISKFSKNKRKTADPAPMQESVVTGTDTEDITYNKSEN